MANNVVIEPSECEIILRIIHSSQFTIGGGSIEPLYILIQKLKSGLPQQEPPPVDTPTAGPVPGAYTE